MQSPLKLQPAHRTTASPNLLAEVRATPAQLHPAPLPQIAQRTAMKRARKEGEGQSTLITSEENCPPSTKTPAPEEEKPKFNGKKVKSLSTVIAQSTDSSFLRITDTQNLYDVWFLPRKVGRTSSENFLNVEFAVVISGTSLVMVNHMYKLAAEELLKMIFLTRKMRAAIEQTPFPFVYFQEWKEKEFAYFTTSPDVVRGDSSEAAFAEYEFTKESFKLRQYNRQCCVCMVFRKVYQHIYQNDITGGAAAPVIYGSVENPNLIECTAYRGSYSYCIEIRMMYIDVGEEEEGDTEPLASQPF